MHKLLWGVSEIAEFLNHPISTVRGWTKEMLAAKVVKYAYKGTPPNRRRYICGFSDDIKEWFMNNKAEPYKADG